MFLFRTFIARFLWRERIRAIATVLGIALGVAVVVAIRLANASSLRGFETALDTMAGRTSVEIVGSALGIEETRLPELWWLRDFGVVSPIVEGDAMVLGSGPGAEGWGPEGVPHDGPLPPASSAAGVNGAIASRGGARGEMVRVLGIDILRDRSIRDYQISGAETADALSMLSMLTDDDAVIVTEKFARSRGVAVGDTLAIVAGDRESTLVVRGLLRNEGPARLVDGNLFVMDIAAAQSLFDRLGRIDRLDVRLAAPERIDADEVVIAQRLPEGFSAQRPSRRGQQVERMLASFQLNLTALSFVAFLVGLFLVYNTVSTSVIVRRGEIGTLRALGVSSRQVLLLFVAEAGVMGAAGCGLGLLLGRALADGALAFTSSTVNALYIATAAAPPDLGVRDVVWAFGVGIPLSVVAALLPALEAARVAPMAAIRGADRLETRFSVRPGRLLAPIALLGIAGVLATLPSVNGVPIAGFASAFALVFGAAAFVPIVLFALGRTGRGWMPRALGVEGLLANANLLGAIPRLSVSVAALSVALSMMVAIAIMIGSFRETVVHWVGQTLVADLFIGPSTRSAGARQATISADVEDLVAHHPSVAAVDRFKNVTLPFGNSQVTLIAGDFSVLLSRGTLLFKAPSDGRAAMAGAIGRDAVVVSEAFSLKHGKRVGDVVRLPSRSGEAVFEIAAIYYDYSTDRGVISMDGATFTRHFGEWRPTGLTTYLREGADIDATRAALLASIGSGHEVFIYTNRSLRNEVMRIFDATFAVTYALEAIAILVAVMGVAGTLLTLILERRREIAMLRLVGAERAQVRRMVVLEAGLLGAVSQGVGLVVGLLLSLVLIFVINVQSFGWTIQFHVPWLFLAQMSAAILLFTTLAGLYPAHLASRMSIAGEVGEE